MRRARWAGKYVLHVWRSYVAVDVDRHQASNDDDQTARGSSTLDTYTQALVVQPYSKRSY